MDFDLACKKITKYLESASSTPIIVDVADMSGIIRLEGHFKVGANVFCSSSKFCEKDSLPQIDKLIDYIQKRKKKIFLTHLSSFLKIQGEEELRRTLRSFLELAIEGKLVIVTYQCSELLTFSDPRLEAAGKIIKIDPVPGMQPKLPLLCFVSPELSNNYEAVADGLNNIASIVENSDTDAIYVVTNKNKSLFSNSLYAIKQNSTAFEVLSKINPDIASVGNDAGTDEQWNWLMTELKEYDNWNDYIIKTFGSPNTLALNIGNINKRPENEQWAYFIALKCNGVQNNEYLSNVVGKSSCLPDLWDNIYCLILKTDVKSKSFRKRYNERKEILSKIEIPINIRANFCKQVLQKKENAIYYLTDTCIQEKELVIQMICDYADVFDRKKMLFILSVVYPDLHSYLSDYDYGNEQLTEYFNAYKYNKVTNYIPSEFLDLVEKYAVDRIYYSVLNRRSSIVAKKDKSQSKMYFFDALGVEFLNYIRERCFSKNLSFEVDLAYCELPSITSLNKDFCKEFEFFMDVKDLDELKHKGKGSYTYEQTKLPLHLIKELEIIDHIINLVEKDLFTEGIERVFLIADHGASRLAVINESENNWEMKVKGEHSGRCCPKSDIEGKPDFAVEDNDFWCLANYDRFKGGRKAAVEVHGGATLEEVVVPIIEIKKAGDKPKCEICESHRIITVSFKQKAKIKIFVAKLSEDIKVSCNGKYYDAVPSDNKYIYDVDMPDIKRGHHSIDVYDGTTKIAEGLKFEAKSAGASENRYF